MSAANRRLPEARGQKGLITLDIGTMASGWTLSIPVHVIIGRHAGPTLTLVGTQHGEELGAVSVFRSLLGMLDPVDIRGRVIIIPVANPIAFEHQQRATWIDGLYDATTGNLNRLWPGKPNGFVTERIAHAIKSSILEVTDYLIDFHGSEVAGLSIYYCYLMPDDGSEVADRCRQLALAFGMEIIMERPGRHAGGGDTLSDYAYRELRLPAFPVEIGEFYGFEGEPPRDVPARTVPEVGVTGVFNVMKILGMVEGRPILPTKQVIVRPETRCQSSQGGLLEPLVTRKDIGRVFPRGTILGRVLNPYSFEVIDEIRAPYESNLLVTATDGMPFTRVSPGDQAFHVADFSTAQWIYN